MTGAWRRTTSGSKLRKTCGTNERGLQAGRRCRGGWLLVADAARARIFTAEPTDPMQRRGGRGLGGRVRRRVTTLVVDEVGAFVQVDSALRLAAICRHCSSIRQVA